MNAQTRSSGPGAPSRRRANLLWSSIWIGAFEGALGGVVEAALLAAQTRRFQSFTEFFGYAALIDAGALATLGALAALLVAFGARLFRRTVDPAWHVTVVTAAGWLVVAVLAVLRLRPRPEAGLTAPASVRQEAMLIIIGAVALSMLSLMALAPRGGSARRALQFGKIGAPVASVILLAASIVGVWIELGARGAAAEPAPVPVAAAPSSPIGQPAPLTAPLISGAPNVLLITVDTLRGDHIGPSGYRDARTPTMDRLARDGVYFSRHYTNRNGTTPAHASIFTGTYPSTNGVWTHMFDLLPPQVPTLAESFQARGYSTAGFFSWLSFEPAYSGLQRGFQVYEDLTINLPDYLENPRMAALAATYKRIKSTLALPSFLDRELAFSADIEEVLDGKADITTDAALLWLQEHVTAPGAGQPFFVWIHYWDPHYPFTPPPPFDQIPDDDCPGCPDGSISTIRLVQSGGSLGPAETRHLIKYYDAEIAFLDRELGRLLDAMDNLGLRDNTLVILVGDHGESFGEIGRWLHAYDLYVPEIHVPLIMRYPGTLPAGVRVSSISRSVDIMPTTLELLQLPVPASVEGESLVPLIHDPDGAPDRFAIAELSDRRLVTIVTQDWQLIKDVESGEVRLFRPTGAPLDELDRAGEEPEVTAELSARLDRWLEAHP